MPHFDWTISLGNVLTVVGFIIAAWLAGTRIYNGIDRRLIAFEGLLSHHAATLVDHAARMKTQDDMLLRLVGDVQRLIGRMEGSRQSLPEHGELFTRRSGDH